MSGLLFLLDANIVLTLALVYTIGFWGIPVATAISMLISCVWFLFAMNGVLNVPAGELFRSALQCTSLASLPVLVLCGGADYWLTFSGRIPNLLCVVLLAGCSAALYLVGIIRLNVFGDEETAQIRKAVATMRGML